MIDTLNLREPYKQSMVHPRLRSFEAIPLLTFNLCCKFPHQTQITLRTSPALGSFLQISSDRLGNSHVARPRGTEYRNVGHLVGEVFGVMDAGGDGSDFVSKQVTGAAIRGASDTEAINLCGSSARSSRGGEWRWWLGGCDAPSRHRHVL